MYYPLHSRKEEEIYWAGCGSMKSKNIRDQVDLKQAAKDFVYLSHNGTWKNKVILDWAFVVCKHFKQDISVSFLIGVVGGWIIEEFAKD